MARKKSSNSLDTRWRVAHTWFRWQSSRLVVWECESVQAANQWEIGPSFEEGPAG